MKHTIAISLAVLVGCGQGTSAGGDPGFETGPCLEDQCVGPDLVCSSNLCVDPDNMTGPVSDTDPEDNGGSGDGIASGDSSGSSGNSPEACDVQVEPSADDQTALAEALGDAGEGSTVCLSAGTFTTTAELRLDSSGVTLRGAGRDMTILDFSGQLTGGSGLLVASDNVTLSDFAVHDAPGDGIRADQVSNITFERVSVRWAALHSLENGERGLHSVQAAGVTVRDCQVTGARDVGIYVGQSTNILVEDSIANDNVVGIGIENSTDAIVRRNEAFDNTAGLLVLNSPGLEVEDGRRCNVYENDIHDNNVDNFADPSSVVGIVPPGVGMFVLAADETEIHSNTFANNRTVGVAIFAYSSESGLFEKPRDPNYDLWSETNFVHDNTYTNNATDPDALFVALTGDAMPSPDVLFDGCFAIDKDNSDGALSNCVGEADTVNWMDGDLCGDGIGVVTDVSLVACTHPPLPTE